MLQEDTPAEPSCKRRRILDEHCYVDILTDDSLSMIMSLINGLGQQVALRFVCRRWRRVFDCYASNFIDFGHVRLYKEIETKKFLRAPYTRHATKISLSSIRGAPVKSETMKNLADHCKHVRKLHVSLISTVEVKTSVCRLINAWRSTLASLSLTNISLPIKYLRDITIPLRNTLQSLSLVGIKRLSGHELYSELCYFTKLTSLCVRGEPLVPELLSIGTFSWADSLGELTLGGESFELSSPNLGLALSSCRSLHKLTLQTTGEKLPTTDMTQHFIDGVASLKQSLRSVHLSGIDDIMLSAFARGCAGAELHLAHLVAPLLGKLTDSGIVDFFLAFPNLVEVHVDSLDISWKSTYCVLTSCLALEKLELQSFPAVITNPLLELRKQNRSHDALKYLSLSSGIAPWEDVSVPNRPHTASAYSHLVRQVLPNLKSLKIDRSEILLSV